MDDEPVNKYAIFAITSGLIALVVWVWLSGLDVGGCEDFESSECLKDHPTRYKTDTMIAVITALGIFGAGYFTFQRAEAAHHQIDQQQQEHATERYGRAIEQLGHDRIEVRIGGIYALEALAVDSAQRWAATVYENLVAYLKEHIPTTGPGIQRVGQPPRAGTDVHAVLTVLSRRRALFDTNVGFLAEDNQKQFGTSRSPEVGVHLVNVKLKHAWLIEFDFSEATLTRVNFRNARFTGSVFTGATLTSVVFDETTIISSLFREAKLDYVSFRKAKVHHAQFSGRKLSNSVFDDAELHEVGFSGTKTSNTNRFDKAHVDLSTMNALKELGIPHRLLPPAQ